MADEEKQQAEGAEPKKGKSNLILILAIALVVALGGGFAVWKFVLSGDDAKADTQAEEQEGKIAGDDGDSDEPFEWIMTPLDPFIVNLFDGEGVRYLKVKIEMQIKDIHLENIRKMIPQVRNSLIILLSSKKYSEIGSIEGKVRLRQEILYRLHRILGEGKVKDVYFTDFVVQ